MRSLRRPFLRSFHPAIQAAFLGMFAFILSFTLHGAFLLVAPIYAQPQPKTPAAAQGLEGNWLVERVDYPRKGAIERKAFALIKPWKQECQRAESGGCRYVSVRDDAGPWRLFDEPTYVASRIGGHAVAISGSGQVEFNWGGRSVVRQVSPNEMRGRWSYGDQGGTEVWRRAIPRVTRVKFFKVSAQEVESEVAYGTVTGRVQGTYTDTGWGPGNNMRGNRPSFRVEVYGDSLWGHHVIDMEDAVDLEPLLSNYIQDPSASGVPGHVIGLTIGVVIWSQATPGPKTLRIDGIRIPFDFVVKGHPAETRPELRFVRQSGAAFEEIKQLNYAEPFFVEAEFGAASSEIQKTVTLEWGAGQSKQIEVKRTADPKIFRSGTLYVEPPTTAEAGSAPKQ